MHVACRVTLAKDIVSSIGVAQGKVAIGAGIAIGVGGLLWVAGSK
ncbi:MAG: hypothetical protein ACI9EP_001504 [Oceanospirillaceae bacterium]|jgi:hypothetical protein